MIPQVTESFQEVIERDRNFFSINQGKEYYTRKITPAEELERLCQRNDRFPPNSMMFVGQVNTGFRCRVPYSSDSEFRDALEQFSNLKRVVQLQSKSKFKAKGFAKIS